MAICYSNLWKLLIDKNMNKTELKEAAGISFNVMARMGKNETISFESIEKICIQYLTQGWNVNRQGQHILHASHFY